MCVLHHCNVLHNSKGPFYVEVLLAQGKHEDNEDEEGVDDDEEEDHVVPQVLQTQCYLYLCMQGRGPGVMQGIQHDAVEESSNQQSTFTTVFFFNTVDQHQCWRLEKSKNLIQCLNFTDKRFTVVDHIAQNTI